VDRGNNCRLIELEMVCNWLKLVDELCEANVWFIENGNERLLVKLRLVRTTLMIGGA
jgi:hypothetical protein